MTVISTTGPRLSFSWASERLKNKTVLRVGAGYYYGPGQTEDQVQPILIRYGGDRRALGQFVQENPQRLGLIRSALFLTLDGKTGKLDELYKKLIYPRGNQFVAPTHEMRLDITDSGINFVEVGQGSIIERAFQAILQPLAANLHF